MDRRTLIKSTVVGMPGLVIMQSMAGAARAQESGYGDDADILNYALIAEYFLSQFYREARGLLSGKDADYIGTIGADEDAHIAAITQTVQNMGGEPVPPPPIDYGDAFDSRENILRLALRFENLFAGAYLDAARFVKNPDVLQAAAGIFGVEARHAAIVANMLDLPPARVYAGAFATPADKATVLKALKPYLTQPSDMADEAAVTF